MHHESGRLNSETKKVIDPDSLNVILATDCGSTTTKAILIERVDGVYRQTYRGEAPTTVEEPAADVTVKFHPLTAVVGRRRPGPGARERLEPLAHSSSSQAGPE